MMPASIRLAISMSSVKKGRIFTHASTSTKKYKV